MSSSFLPKAGFLRDGTWPRTLHRPSRASREAECRLDPDCSRCSYLKANKTESVTRKERLTVETTAPIRVSNPHSKQVFDVSVGRHKLLEARFCLEFGLVAAD